MPSLNLDRVDFWLTASGLVVGSTVGALASRHGYVPLVNDQRTQSNSSLTNVAGNLSNTSIGALFGALGGLVLAKMPWVLPVVALASWISPINDTNDATDPNDQQFFDVHQTN